MRCYGETLVPSGGGAGREDGDDGTVVVLHGGALMGLSGFTPGAQGDSSVEGGPPAGATADESAVGSEELGLGGTVTGGMGAGATGVTEGDGEAPPTAPILDEPPSPTG
ncbi:MAG: hypothetical protein U0236_12060 [Nitrospira sp.]